jgi:hypothetical protein
VHGRVAEGGHNSLPDAFTGRLRWPVTGGAGHTGHLADSAACGRSGDQPATSTQLIRAAAHLIAGRPATRGRSGDQPATSTQLVRAAAHLIFGRPATCGRSGGRGSRVAAWHRRRRPEASRSASPAQTTRPLAAATAARRRNEARPGSSPDNACGGQNRLTPGLALTVCQLPSGRMGPHTQFHDRTGTCDALDRWKAVRRNG